MMKFRTAKTALVKMLGDNSHGRYRTIGYMTQSKHADALKNNDRLVSVFYDQGNFTKEASSYYGAISHDMSFEIVLSASALPKCDLSVLNNEQSTATERAIAIAEMTNASDTVDTLIDELFDIVFNIIMDAENDGLVLSDGTVIANRWIDSFQKYDTLPNGNTVVKTAVIKYSCRVDELPGGATGNYPDAVTISADNGEKTGATIVNDNTEV